MARVYEEVNEVCAEAKVGGQHNPRAEEKVAFTSIIESRVKLGRSISSTTTPHTHSSWLCGT